MVKEKTQINHMQMLFTPLDHLYHLIMDSQLDLHHPNSVVFHRMQ